MMRLAFFLVFIIALVLSPTPAIAFTDFFGPFSRATEVRFPSELGAPQNVVVLAIDAQGQLGWRRHTVVNGHPEGFQPWQRRQLPVEGFGIFNAPPDFFVATGIASVVPPETWGTPRAYVVSPSGIDSQANPVPARIWEIAWNNGWAFTPTWRVVSESFGAPDLDNNPQIAATFWNGSVWLAVRDADGGLSSCRIFDDTMQCGWEDESCRGTTGCHQADTSSPVAINTGIDGDLEIYELTGHQPPQIHRYRWNADNWDVLPAIPTPVGGNPRWLDLASLQVDTNSSETRLFALAWDQTTLGDELWAARTTGSAWTWRRLILPEGDPYGGYDYRLHNLSLRRVGPLQRRVFAVNAYGTEVGGCWIPKDLSGAAESIWCDDPLGSGGLPGTNIFPRPGEMLATRDTFGSSVTATAEQILLNGALGPAPGGARYQYALNLGSTSWWSNFLAPRSPAPEMPDTVNRSEYDADEWFGSIAVVMNNSRVLLSQDDGSTWTSAGDLVAGARGDPNLGFDSQGTLYVSTLINAPSPPPPQQQRLIVVIGRRNQGSTSTFGGFALVPTTYFPGNPIIGRVFDRPWWRTDHLRNDFGLLTWWDATDTGAAGAGLISYCNGTGDCSVGSPATWCGPWSLPLGSSCRLPAGCPITIAGPASNRTAWIVIDNDQTCAAPPTGFLKRLGLRRILNYSLLGASCVAPEYSAPECYYYVDSAIRGSSPPPPLPPIDSQIRSITTTPAPIGPGEDRRWSVQVSSNDYEPHVTLTFQIYRDVLGGPCVTSSTRCRSEIAFVRRRAEYFNSCGSPPCSFNVEDVDSYFSNLDQNRSSEGAVTWIDHIHPQTAVLPGGFVGVVWQDFRTDLPVGIAGDFILNSMVVDPIATGWFPAAVLVATEHPWSLSALWRPVNLSGSYLGDVFYPAVSQLHAHFFVPHMTNPSAPTINARTSVWSPVSPEHEP